MDQRRSPNLKRILLAVAVAAAGALSCTEEPASRPCPAGASAGGASAGEDGPSGNERGYGCCPCPDGGIADGQIDPSDGGSTSSDPQGGRVIGYYTSWSIYARKYEVAAIPAEKLTHLNYAFANISDAGEVAVGDSWADLEKAYPGDSWDTPIKGNFGQLIKLKAKHPHLKTLISVGGWTWSGVFSDVASTQAARDTFAASAVDFIVKYKFDGVDIDWEYPVAGGLATNKVSPQDKQNFTLLMSTLRQKLDQQGSQDGRKYLLTAAVSAGADKIDNLEVSKLSSTVDWLCIMTYDFHGAWENTTNHHAALYASSKDPSPNALIKTKYNAHTAIQRYLADGAPPDKIILGVPFYGRAWKGVPAANNGLFQSSTGVPPGTWDDWQSGATGVNDYWEIKKLEASPDYTRYWDAEANAPYLYAPTVHQGHMISYEDQQSLTLKLQYVSKHKLGGVMFWELSGDDHSVPQSSLLETIHKTLHTL